MSDNQQVNIPLLRKAVEWAEAEAAKPAIDSEWDQNTWVRDADSKARGLMRDEYESYGLVDVLAPHCGTSFCIAGYIGQMLEPAYAKSEYVNDVHVSGFAAEALGIGRMEEDYEDEEFSHELFNGSNSIEDVRRIAEDIAGERL